MRIMGLDIGTKRIGVALSDPTGIIAQGKEVIDGADRAGALKRIKEIIEEFDVSEIVVGLPLNLDGTTGIRAEDSIKFSETLRKETGLSVKLWDERYSTSEVENIMIKASVRRDKRKKVIDKVAAQIILQGYLDSRVNRQSKGERP